MPVRIDRKIIVAHVVEACYGGVATFIEMLIREQLNDREIGEVHVIADPSTTQKSVLELTAAFHFYYGSRKLSHAIRIAADVKRKLEQIRPSVVILHSTYPGVWGRTFRSRSWRTIYCAHGWAFNQSISRVKRVIYGLIEAGLSYRCDAIVSISHYDYVSACERGIRGKAHYVILHGIPDLQISRKNYSLSVSPDSKIHLAFVGRFEHQKGADILSDIFQDPQLSSINVSLIGGQVGSGIPIEITPRDNFHFLGWLPRDQIESIFDNVDALIMPSRSEGLGLVAIEAMRSGRAVLASRVGGLEEVVTEGVTGYFIDINDITACRNVLKSLTKEELLRMGANARIEYELRFQWSHCYKSWRLLINSLI